MMHFLSGRKTYVLAGVAAIGAFLQTMGLMSRENWEMLIGILTPLVIMTLRSAVAEVKQDVSKIETAVIVQAAQVKQTVAQVQAVVVNKVEDVVAKVETVEAKVEAIPAVQLPHR